jgi:hypothetical protein
MYFLQCPTTVPPRFKGKRRLPCSHSCTVKGGGGLPATGVSGHVGRSLSGFSLPRGRSGITEHAPQPTPLLAETWELPSLSRLACIPYYKHSGCKIIQCPRTPPLLDVRPRGRNQDKPCVTVLPLASSSGMRKHAAFTRWDPGPRVGIPTVGAPGRGSRVTFSLFFPFDLQGWRVDPTRTLWVFRIRSRQDIGSGSGVSSLGQPATITSCSSSRPDATPSPRLHQPGATGARANARDKHARSDVARHATAPPYGLRLACRNSASRPTGPPFHHHVPRRHLRRHHHLQQH